MAYIMKIKLIATGSRGDFYDMLLDDDSGKLFVLCTCPAAQKNWMCRHVQCLFRMDEIDIEDMFLYDKKNSKAAIGQAMQLLQQNPFVTMRFQKLISTIDELEQSFESIKNINKECVIYIKEEMLALVHPDHAPPKFTITDLDAIYKYLIENKIVEYRNTLENILKKLNGSKK